MCRVLIDALSFGIQRSFGAYIERREILIASAYLPEFKVGFFYIAKQDLARNYLLDE
ncbi:Uncharacterized protein FKW44_004099, partial [Caligus rogercresseyi]